MNIGWHQFSVYTEQTLQGFFMLVVIFTPLEMAFSVRDIPFLRRNLAQDLLFFFLNGLLAPLLLSALLGVFVAAVRPLYGTGLFVWVPHIPLLLRFALAVIIGDIGAYWGHRWSHEIPFLWHFHRIHHQAEAIDWLVTSRAHPLDMVFVKFCGVAFIYLSGLAQASLGQGSMLMTTYLLVGSVWAYFVHANVNWRLGPLEHWLASPAFHHWHHSNESPHSIDKNYSAIFPWIDRLFGTLYLPTKRWPTSYGEKVSTSVATSESNGSLSAL